MELVYYLPILFFLIALFYSSVGFGGGSSYLAILALVIPQFQEVRSTALLLNITVVSISTIQFIRNKQFSLKDYLPFILASIPLSFLAATIKISEQRFFICLGIALILAGISMLVKFLFTKQEERKFSLIQKLGLGGIIGFLSGITGIGGGIYLSPILNLFSWKNAKAIAALASFFILVNSISGITGLILTDQFRIRPIFFLMLFAAVTFGGLAGNFLHIKKFPTKWVGILTAVLVLYVGLQLVL